MPRDSTAHVHYSQAERTRAGGYHHHNINNGHHYAAKQQQQQQEDNHTGLFDAGNNFVKLIGDLLPATTSTISSALASRRRSDEDPTAGIGAGTSKRWPPPITPPPSNAASNAGMSRTPTRRIRKGSVVAAAAATANHGANGGSSEADSAWKRSRSVPSTPRNRKSNKMRQQQQQQQQNSGDSDKANEQQQQKSPTPTNSTRSSFRAKAETLDRAVAALVRRTQSQKAPSVSSVAAAAASAAARKRSLDDWRMSTLPSQDEEDEEVARTNKIREQAEHHPDRSIAEDVLNWCGDNIPRIGQATLEVGGLGAAEQRSPSHRRKSRSGLVPPSPSPRAVTPTNNSFSIRGPFVRAPTANNSSNDHSNSSSVADIAGLALKDQQQQQQQQQQRISEGGESTRERQGSDSTTSSLEVENSTRDGLMTTSALSPFHSPATSPISPPSRSRSPNASPLLRRKRAEQRASSTGSATAATAGGNNLASSICGSRGSSFSSHHQPQNLLSPYSASPAVSRPTSPTNNTPSSSPNTKNNNNNNSLFHRRLSSSCRPSLSSCSNSSLILSESNSPEPSSLQVQGKGPNAGPLSPRSPGRSNVGKTASLGSGGSGSVFVYPPPSPTVLRKIRADDFGRLNPDLYRDLSLETSATDENVDTALRFRLDYAADKEWLEVRLLKVKALPRDSSGEVSVRATLLPDERRVFTEVVNVGADGKRDAELDVTFVIPVQRCDLYNRSLKLTLSHRPNAHNSTSSSSRSPPFIFGSSSSSPRKLSFVSLGEVTKTLKIVNFESNEPQLFTETLHHPMNGCSTDSDYSSFGEQNAGTGVSNSADSPDESLMPRLKVSLCYNGTLERLVVAVYDCEGLQQWDSSVHKCYVKISQLQCRSSKSKKTDAVKCSNNEDISFNQSFNFKVATEEMSDVGVMLQLLECNILGKDRVLGQLVLGGPMLARGCGEDHWRRAVAAAVHKETILMWHRLSKPE